MKNLFKKLSKNSSKKLMENMIEFDKKKGIVRLKPTIAQMLVKYDYKLLINTR